jgi:putative tricarboxylic transport membrane protein
VNARGLRVWLGSGDRVAGAVLLFVALLVLWECRKLPFGTLLSPGPAFMPVVLATVVLICGILLIATGSDLRLRGEDLDWRRVPAILAAAAFAAWGIERLGYRLTMLLVLLFLVAVVERRGVFAAVIFATAMACGTFFVFDTLLKTPLPRGPFDI